MPVLPGAERERRKLAIAPFSQRFLPVLSVLAIAGMAGLARGQAKRDQAPYASLGEHGASYAGPGREAAFDLSGPVLRIGVLAPLHGQQKADGEAILTAARMALQDESAKPLPGGLRLALATADESVPPWGTFGDEIIHLVVEEPVIAVITSADAVTAHLSEQIGNKIGVPVLTLSSDPTTTEINLPWIFRLGPSDTVEAEAMARNIYSQRKFRRVILVTESDHDGRRGAAEFEQAARQVGAAAPVVFVAGPKTPAAESLPARIRRTSPQAVVFWTRPQITGQLVRAIRQAGERIPVYLSEESAQASSGMQPLVSLAPESGPETNATAFTIEPGGAAAPWRASFFRRYQATTGTVPSVVAGEAYDAIRLIVRAVRAAGASRARVRDQIAGVRGLEGAFGAISFDKQGNNQASARLVPLH